MFKIGDQIFYPAVGVGIIEEVIKRNLGEGERSFFKIRVEVKRATVMVPVDDFERVGLRPIMDAETVVQVFHICGELPDDDLFRSWSKSFRNYEERLKSEDPFEVAEIFRNLTLQAQRKILSFGEKRVLDLARQLVVQEVSCSTCRPEADVLDELNAQIEEVWNHISPAA